MLEHDVNARRRYDNSGRARQAAATRRAILDATRRVIVDKGYAGTTMAAVAREAGVSVETIYKRFGTKRELVQQMLGVAVVGDDEPVALIDRPALKAATTASSGTEMLTRMAAASRDILERLGPLSAILLISPHSLDPELREFTTEMGAKRLEDFAVVVRAVAATGDLRPDLDESRAADIVWTLASPEVHQALTRDRGWSNDEYEHWLAQTLIDAVMRRPDPAPPQHLL